MDEFLVNISTFPVSIFTVGLGVVFGYWLVSLIGLFDLDAFSADAEIDADISDLGAVAGVMTALGLNGVPLTIVISLLMLNGWFISYFVSKLVPHFPELFSIVEIALNIGVIIVSLVLSLFVSAIMVRPLKGIFKQLNQEPLSRSIIGRQCRVRSSKVDQSYGEVECVFQGASLILKVRSFPEVTFTTGDLVVLVEHQAKDDSFLVISEEKFKKELES